MYGTCVYCGHYGDDPRHGTGATQHVALIAEVWSDRIDADDESRAAEFSARHHIALPRGRHAPREPELEPVG